MNIVIHIPHWVIWVIGIPVGLLLLFFAAFGIAWFVSMWNWNGPC